ncbi:MAG: phosphate ABC transporter permease PstA [Cyanobium sp.]
MARSGAARFDRVFDIAMALLAWLVALLVVGMIGWIVADLLRQGLPRLSWAFLVELPGDAGRSGGIRPILISTLLILGVCLAVSVPIGLATAVFLAEFQRGHWGFGRLVRYSLDTLAGVPSIVFGLFGNAFFSITLGLGFSILSGGLTLACMVLPLLIRSMETALRAVPAEHRLAAAALGLPQRVSLLHIVLPAAAPGLAVGLVLGIGRALAETAALLFTSGYVDRLPDSLLDSGRALSVHIFDLAMNVPGGASQASATALVLVALVLLINAFTGWAARRWLACLDSPAL